MAYNQDNGKPCLKCNKDKCSGFSKHSWRASCTNCQCSYVDHDVDELTTGELTAVLDELDLSNAPCYAMCAEAQSIAKNNNLHSLPIGIHPAEIENYLNSLPTDEIPRGPDAAKLRNKRFRRQIPPQDRKPGNVIEATWDSRFHSESQDADKILETELHEANEFKDVRNERDLGVGIVNHMNEANGQDCFECLNKIEFGQFCIQVRPEHNTSDDQYENSQPNVHAWHLNCFRCTACSDLIVDNMYAWYDNRPYCIRHYGQKLRSRCATCDQLIFSNEYTRAMEQEHHSGHFACRSCDASLTGQRYILRDDEPHCLACYEAKFANTCEQCKEKIGCDSKNPMNSNTGSNLPVRDVSNLKSSEVSKSSTHLSKSPNQTSKSNVGSVNDYSPLDEAWQCDSVKDLSFKDRHWHEKCFKCVACSASLADRPFAVKEEQLYCSDCHDERFAAKCDGCQGVFKAGMRKYEYRGQQWHEECFLCVECKQPIGAKSFIPRDNQVVCVPCYEAKYAQRCTKCTEVIRRGGVTYKGNPWHKECFTCTNCTKQLAGLKFTSKDEQPYCADCYGELFAKKCTKCTKPITGFGGCKFISFEDRHWHSECFLCGKCNNNLVGKGFHTSEDLIMCAECGH